MKIISAQPAMIKEMVAFLQTGKVTAYPTETVYGLGCDATNQLAVKNIFRIKGRQSDKALPILVSSIAMLKKYFIIDIYSHRLVDKYWNSRSPEYDPQKLVLTLILNFNCHGREIFKRFINQKNFDAAVRVCRHPEVARIIKKLRKPLVATSANPSGQPAALNAQDVLNYFKNNKNKPDVIWDGGNLKKSKGSTLIDFRSGKIKILRNGNLSAKQIKNIL